MEMAKPDKGKSHFSVRFMYRKSYEIVKFKANNMPYYDFLRVLTC